MYVKQFLASNQEETQDEHGSNDCQIGFILGDSSSKYSNLQNYLLSFGLKKIMSQGHWHP